MFLSFYEQKVYFKKIQRTFDVILIKTKFKFNYATII